MTKAFSSEVETGSRQEDASNQKKTLRNPQPDFHDVIILGAGAAGLMCAGVAGQRGRSVLVLEQARQPGEKIRISGGGRCNFTNLHTSPANFLSDNPRFCHSALSGYTQRDFVALVEAYGIAWYEKTRGQLFCDGSSRQIIDMLLEECRKGRVQLCLGTKISATSKAEAGFVVVSDQGEFRGRSLVVATGGPSIPKMGSSGFGYKIAEQFALKIVPPRAALVPLTFDPALLARFGDLSGVSVDAVVSCGKTSFDEALLFTHRGLSGPAILQISSYWREGNDIVVDLAPGTDVLAGLKRQRGDHPRQEMATALAELLPKRLARTIADLTGGPERIADFSDVLLAKVATATKQWRVRPNGTEGYRTAEVTLGGVDTAGLSSKTFESRSVPGLYFIGEVVDVTGHLGGFNFQWAWSSGVAAGRDIARNSAEAP
jgi:predicted Rossmann fold flavoprotein